MKLNLKVFKPILNRQKSPEHIACQFPPAQAYFSQKVGSRNSSKKLSKQKSSEDRSILAASPRKLLLHHRSPPKKNATQLNVATVRGRGNSNAKSNKSLRIYRRSLTDAGYKVTPSGRGRGAKRPPPYRSNMHCDAWSSDTLSTFD